MTVAAKVAAVRRRLPQTPTWQRSLVWLPLLALALAGLLGLTPLQRHWSNALHDISLRWLTSQQPEAPSTDVLVIDIDDDALHQLEPTLGPWPYRRDLYALLIDTLRRAGARLIVFDIVFSGARPGDDALARAINQGHDVVLAASAQPQASGADAARSDPGLSSLFRPAGNGEPAATDWPALVLPDAGLLSGILAGRLANTSTAGKDPAVDHWGSVGVLSAPLDSDGVLRRLPLLHQAKGWLLPSLPLAAWLMHEQANAEPLRELLRHWPHDAQSRIAYLPPANARAIPQLTFATLLADALGQTAGQTTRAAVAGRTVFVGSSAFLAGAVMTPLGTRRGLEVQASAYDALLHGSVLRPAGAARQAALLALALAPSLWAWRRRRTALLVDGSAALAVALLVGAASLAALSGARVLLDAVPALVTLGFGLLLSLLAGLRAAALANHQLASERSSAQAASRAKAALVAEMSHELRAPMNAVLGFAELLSNDRHPPLAPHHQEWVGAIRRGGQHLLAVINAALDQAAAEAGKLVLVLHPVPVRALVQECLTLMRPLAEAGQIRLYGAGDGPWPGDAAELASETVPREHLVQGDPRRLKQVLLNLLSNAIKYNRNGGSVRVSIQREAAEVLVSVSDTGSGLSAAQVERLFGAFERVGGAADAAVEGSGLGLALSRQLVEQMHGSIGVDSGPAFGVDGQPGSRFWVRLSCAEPAMLLEPATPGLALADPTDQRVLYIDDDPVNVVLMEGILASHGWRQFRSAHCGADGLASALAYPPDVILLDIQMPGMDGFEVHRRLRASAATRAIPVIGVSATNLPSDQQATQLAGFDGYVTKPLEVAPLMQALQGVLLSAARAGADRAGLRH